MSHNRHDADMLNVFRLLERRRRWIRRAMILLASVVLTNDRVMSKKQQSELGYLVKKGKTLWQR